MITVYSKSELSATDKTKIHYIMRESKCPNESLKNTFGDRYTGIEGETAIFFDGAKARGSVETNIF